MTLGVINRAGATEQRERPAVLTGMEGYVACARAVRLLAFNHCNSDANHCIMTPLFSCSGLK